jgi:flagellin
MGYRITSTIALNAINTNNITQDELNKSIERVGTGLRINRASDDASGMSIANELRSKSKSLIQAIQNTNDGIGIVKIADNAMDKQIKLIEKIKVKSIEAAQSSISSESRNKIQNEIVKLMDDIDKIAITTRYNNQSLLSGTFTNKKFQIGAYSNESILANIDSTTTDKIGHTRFETGATITSSSIVSLNFIDAHSSADISLESVVISTSAGTGIGVLAETINKHSEKLGLKSSWSNKLIATDSIKSGSIGGLSINGIEIGNIDDIKANDKDSKLVNSINSTTDNHGIVASVDESGRLNLSSIDGRGIKISAKALSNSININNSISTRGAGYLSYSSINSILSINNKDTLKTENYGNLTLKKIGTKDIIISGSTQLTSNSIHHSGISAIGFGLDNIGKKVESEVTINLKKVKSGFTIDEAEAIGSFIDKLATKDIKTKSATNKDFIIGIGVTTLSGAMATIDLADSAMEDLKAIRDDIGYTHSQLLTAMSNLSSNLVETYGAESRIRDTDLAEETSNLYKHTFQEELLSHMLL